jgi:Bacterial SH3 domain
VKNSKLTAVMLALTTVGATMLTSLPAKAATVCKVTDPTGTSLNLRVSPNGKIIGTVKNNTEVYIYEIIGGEKNQPWAKVGSEGRVLGWAFREFISCYQASLNSPWVVIGKTSTGETLFLDLSSAQFTGYGEATLFTYKFTGNVTSRVNKAVTESCEGITGKLRTIVLWNGL